MPLKLTKGNNDILYLLSSDNEGNNSGELRIGGQTTLGSSTLIIETTGSVIITSISSGNIMANTVSSANILTDSLNIYYNGDTVNTTTGYPAMALTSDSHGGYVVTYSSNWDNSTLGYYAFDGSQSTFWHSTIKYDVNGYSSGVTTTDANTSNVYQGEYLQIQLPLQIELNSYILLPRAGPYVYGQGPICWLVFGSNNGSTWYLIDSKTEIDWGTRLNNAYKLARRPGQYSYYRFQFTRANDKIVVVAEIKLIAATYNTSRINLLTTTNGNIGINTSSPSERLYVDGNIYASGTTSKAVSDMRVKENIVNANTADNLEHIIGLNVKCYDYTDEYLNHSQKPPESNYGFIAQEVKTVIPTAVDISSFDMYGDVVSEDGVVSRGIVRTIPDFHFLKKDLIFTEMVGGIQELYKELQKRKELLNELKTRLINAGINIS